MVMRGKIRLASKKNGHTALQRFLKTSAGLVRPLTSAQPLSRVWRNCALAMGLVLALLLALPPVLLAAQVTAVTDRDRIGAGESLQLELRVDGSPDDDPDLGVLDGDWEILNRSQSNQMQLINGSLSRSLVLSLSLMPRRSGNLPIPAICFGSDCSQPLSVTVSEQSVSSGTAAPLLLEAEAQPRQVPVGAQILLTVRVLHRVDLVQASLSEPRFEGGAADIRQLGKDRSFEMRRNGYRYQVIERRYTVFPRQAGQFKISALQLDAQIDAGPSRRDVFGRSLQQVRQNSLALPIEVTEPPGDLGSRYWLSARGLTLEDDWQQHPPTLRVGEPATRTLTLTAAGLPSASLPDLKLPVPDGWKSYPDQPSRQDSENDQGIVGTLQQKLALVPTQPGTVELPAIDLDWYDVSAGQWSRVHLDALKLEVAPAAAGSLVTSSPLQVPAAPVAPVAPAVPSPDEPGSETLPAASGPELVDAGFWPWLSLALGLAWLATLALLWRARRSSPSAKEHPFSGGARGDSERTALKAVLAAAGRNDPQSSRQALLHWSRLRFPEAAGRELEMMCSIGGEPLRAALTELDITLYGQARGPWRGEALCAALKKLTREERKAPEALPPLYPAE